jgi:hypothetical protein
LGDPTRFRVTIGEQRFSTPLQRIFAMPEEMHHIRAL